VNSKNNFGRIYARINSLRSEEVRKRSEEKSGLQDFSQDNRIKIVGLTG